MDEKSFFNRFLPLGGNIGVQQMQTFNISPNATSVDLRTVFGSLDNGDGLLIKADGVNQPSGWRAYFSLTEKATTINETQTTAGSASGGQCWPLTDGQEMFGHLTSGRIQATGFVSMLTFPVLNMKASAGSGMFKVMRHSLVEPQDASRFQPGFPGLPSAIASGYTGILPSGYQARP